MGYSNLRHRTWWNGELQSNDWHCELFAFWLSLLLRTILAFRHHLGKDSWKGHYFTLKRGNYLWLQGVEQEWLGSITFKGGKGGETERSWQRETEMTVQQNRTYRHTHFMSVLLIDKHSFNVWWTCNHASTISQPFGVL